MPLKISQMTSVSALTGSEQVPVVQSSANRRTTILQLFNLALAYVRAATGATARTPTDKMSDVYAGKDFGVTQDGTTNDSAAWALGFTALAALEMVNGTSVITATLSVTDARRIVGKGQQLSFIQNNGTGPAFQTPYTGLATPKSYYQRFADMNIVGVSSTSPAAAALLVRETGPNYFDRLTVSKHESAFQFLGSVGARLREVAIGTCKYGLEFLTDGVAANLNTWLRMSGGVISVTIDAVKVSGGIKGLHFDDVDIESNTNVYVETGGFYAEQMVHRNCWLEGNTNYDYGNAPHPVWDTCHFSGDISITGGYAKVFKDARVTSPSNIGMFRTDGDVCDVERVSNSFYLNAHSVRGMKLTMPLIGSTSTAEDRYAPSASVQSSLFAGFGSGALGSSSEGVTNIITADMSNAGVWANGTATITSGQADPWGGTTAVLANGAGAFAETVALATTSGAWHVYQVLVRAQSAGAEIGLRVTSSATEAKSLYLTLPDTKWRVVHLMFRPDSATSTFAFYHGGGAYVAAMVAAEGAVLRPFVPYGAVVPNGFWMEFGKVVTYGTAAPVAGTWRVGDRVLHTTPASGGNIGWVCTTAGSPGTWKTYGTIA